MIEVELLRPLQGNIPTLELLSWTVQVTWLDPVPELGDSACDRMVVAVKLMAFDPIRDSCQSDMQGFGALIAARASSSFKYLTPS